MSRPSGSASIRHSPLFLSRTNENWKSTSFWPSRKVYECLASTSATTMPDTGTAKEVSASVRVWTGSDGVAESTWMRSSGFHLAAASSVRYIRAVS